MRMRRKRSLDARLEACGEYLFDPDLSGQDSRENIKEYLPLGEMFGFDAPTELEIGCGKGSFIAQLAQRESNRRFIAVEKTRNVICAAVENAVKNGIGNIRFLSIGAEYLLRYFPPKTFERIYLNFSCPYPRRHNANRRLTHPKFLAIYRVLLRDGGDIHMKTDNAGLFEYSIEQFTACGFALRNISLDLHSSEFDEGNIRTEYETKFAAMGKPIYRLEAYIPTAGVKESEE